MMKTVIAFILALWAGQLAIGQETITQQEFETLHAQIAPQDEVWKTIPWETGLLDAQKKAAKEGKPIFIWAMDGHPLGCT